MFSFRRKSSEPIRRLLAVTEKRFWCLVETNTRFLVLNINFHPIIGIAVMARTIIYRGGSTARLGWAD